MSAASTGRHCCPSLEMLSPALGPSALQEPGLGLRQPGVPGLELLQDLPWPRLAPVSAAQVVFHHHLVLSPLLSNTSQSSAGVSSAPGTHSPLLSFPTADPLENE